MSKDTYATDFSKRRTPQSEPIPGRTDMTENSAGGYTFQVDDWARLHRFLVIGSEGGTYYIKQRDLTRENAEVVLRCIEQSPERTVQAIVDISQAGRAPKNDPALFALALCASSENEAARFHALNALPQVARIGTHLFHFLEYIKAQRGWGRSLVRAVQDWYLRMPNDKLALQVVKYKQRDGWSHRDALRKSHPKTADLDKAAIFNYAVKGELPETVISNGGEDLVWFNLLNWDRSLRDNADKGILDRGLVAAGIRKHRLPREIIPTELLNDVEIWDALLENMPMTAMVRNLGKMTSVGLLKPFGVRLPVARKLRDANAIKESRVHPMQILMALKTYAQGKGTKGSLTWTPVPQVLDALNDAFYMAFENVEATGKRFLLGIDCSASMGWPQHMVNGTQAAEIAAAMAMVTAHTESQYHIMGFSGYEMRDLGISKGQRLDDVVRKFNVWGGTDCSLPMRYALDKGLKVDTFVVYTDNETWAGEIHPAQALREYREKTGIPARLAVVGIASNGFTIADPKDMGMMDFVGFDTATPQVLADFAR